MSAVTPVGKSLPKMPRPDRVRVSAVMPCLNEELTIATCIGKAHAAFDGMKLSGEVIVADNGSTDRSVALAENAGARVIHVERRGYGAALLAGIEAARGEFVVVADSDDSYDWLGIEPFIQSLDEGNDLVVGNRFMGGIEPGAMPGLHRYVGNPVLSWLARAVHRAPVGDFHCGMRAFRRDAVLRMNLRTSGMEFATEMIVNSAKAGLKIAEVATPLHRDGRDRPPHLRTFRDGWRHLRFILTYGPNALYLVPGGLSFLTGILLVAALAGGPITLLGHYVGIHFLALGCGLTLVGFNVVHYGILANVIAHRSSPEHISRVAGWVMRRFSLETALLTGTLLIAAGVIVDAGLLWHWIAIHAGSMDSTVHAVFVATLAIVLGVNLSMGAFLLHMLVSEQRP